MQINIWSDIRCPFCLIGKKNFEEALDKSGLRDQVEIFWRSYELDPNIQVEGKVNYVEHFSKIKGVGKEEAMSMFDNVAEMGKNVGINFNFNKAIVANSFDAHRLIHYAKTEDLAEKALDAIFNAHFKEAKDIGSTEVLVDIAKAVGLNEEMAEDVLNTDKFEDRVRQDEHQAQHIGIQGVPFFVFNDKYAISGAQPTEAFLETLQKSFAEYSQEKSLLNKDKK